MLNILRTPDERFANLPGYPFAPNYVEIDGARMHYVDEGMPAAKETVLLLHGEPSWSYLYRKMIPVISAAGHRVVAPDLFGFGKSDKYTESDKYTYLFHIESLKSFIEKLDLQNITLFGQDWGGLLGLRIVAEMPDRFSRIVASNTFLPTGDRPASEPFLAWRAYSQSREVMKIGNIVSGGCFTKLTPEIVAAYDAPFPTKDYQAGAKKFPLLVPITPDDPASEANRAAWEILKKWEKPVLTAFSDSDPITHGGDLVLQKLIPGAQGESHVTVKNAGHFIQEDKGEELAEIIVNFIARTAH